MTTQRDWNHLLRRLASVEAELLKRPLRGGGGGSSPIKTVQIIGGNTLSDGSTAGIKWSASALSTVPSLYDPNVDTSFIDGLGRGTLYSNGVSQGLVLVGNFSGNGSPVSVALVSGQIVLTGTTGTLTLASDSSQSVTYFIPYAP